MIGNTEAGSEVYPAAEIALEDFETLLMDGGADGLTARKGCGVYVEKSPESGSEEQ